jgi:murein tripeptide amidase MpaA
LDFDHYFTNQEIETTLKNWAQAHPDFIQLETIGESYEKRPLWLLTITNRAVPADDKSALWIDANIHATEITGTSAALFAANRLVEGYGIDPGITRLVDEVTFYIVPRVNPDGAALAMAPNPRFVRSGVRRYPWEEKDDGLHVQDVDGDGRILQMRIPDPNGDWKVSTQEPRLMEKRQPDEFGGDYYRLLPEGLLENFDGYLIKLARPPEGLDFNRNFPFEWRTEGEQRGAGPYPASEAETHALVDFISKHTNISVAITFHTFSRVILRPYSTKADDEMDVEDLWTFKKLGEIGTRLTGYRCVSTFHDFKYHPKEVTTGAFDDWMYDQFGAYSYTIELWDLPTAAGIKERKFIDWWREHPHEQDVQILKWVEENTGSGNYIDWYAFDHPQLGKIELGGWQNMYLWRNPPPELLQDEVSRHTPFLLSLANCLPRLKVHTLEVSALGDGLYHINLVVENTGYLPTYTSQQGKKRNVIRPVRVELSLPQEVELKQGKPREELGHLDGRSSDQDTGQFGVANPTSNRARQEWVLHGPPGAQIEVHILSERAGKLHLPVQLG